MIESIDKAASHWLARLDRDDATPEDRAAFETWRTSDPRHAAVYAELETLWNRLDRLRKPDALLSVPPRRRFRVQTSWAAAAAVVTVVSALVIAIVIGSSYFNAASTQRFVTAVGGHERAVLSDGSIAELNTDTQLRVTVDETERRIELLRGEASFEVAHDPRRPFTVTAGDLTLRAVGTIFNVRRHNEKVAVIVVEGKVAVESALGSKIIQAGETAWVAPAGIEIKTLNSEHLQRALAWQKGMLSFENATLAEAVAEFNRYNVRRLVVTDPTIAHLRIGGYFRTTNVDGFVRVLEDHFAVKATREPTQILLSRK